MLHAVVFVAHSIVERQAWSEPEAVLGIKRPVVVAVASPVGSRGQRRSDDAVCWTWADRVAVHIDWAGERTFRIDSGREPLLPLSGFQPGLPAKFTRSSMLSCWEPPSCSTACA